MSKKIKHEWLPSKSDVEHFEMLYPMIVAVLNEVRDLSKRKQDGVLNTLKAKTINKLLIKSKAILSNEPTAEFLELLDEETLPTNSDAVLMIVQFKSAMEQYKDKFFIKGSGDWEKKWQTKN